MDITFLAKKVFVDSDVRHYDCGENNEMLLVDNADANQYISFISELRENGASEVQSSEIDNFRSITLKLDGMLVVVNHDYLISEVRIVTDSFSAPLNISDETNGDAPVKLWQFEVDHTLIDCGMCYIVRLPDYSFFIVDSAHTYSVNDDKRIYELLRKETPEDRQVVIAGWFLSHGHVDHIAKCLDVIKYNNDVVIKGLYYNFVSNEHFSSSSWMISDIKHSEIFKAEAEKRSDIPKYKLHAGQFFYLNGVRFDVMCTHEDVFPRDLENYNDSSVMLMMTAGENKVCFPGDAGGEESIICERRFPDFLSCDVMQISHHGHFGTSAEFYKKANARVALFPVTRIKFDEEYPNYEANRVACKIAEHIFVASEGTVMLTFPLEKSEILIYPDETNESFEGIFNLWGYEYSDEYKRELVDGFQARNKFVKIPY